MLDYDAAGIADLMNLAGDAPEDDLGGGQVMAVHEPAIRFFTADHHERSTSGRRVSSVEIEQAVEAGLPKTVLRAVATRVVGPDKARIAAFEWSIVPKTTLDRRGDRLSMQESERTERVARLFVHARRALGTELEAREFLATAHPELDGRTPIEAARTDLGTRRVEHLLTALEYGLVV